MGGFVLGVIVCAVVIAGAIYFDKWAPIAKQFAAEAKEAIAKLRAGK